jgi:riboflavin kinase/FMN adenylyltransferase
MSLGYRVSGKVQQGAKRGRELGFPTANISLASLIDAPEQGVYACLINLGSKKYYKGVVNIGIRPTFGGKTMVCETHIFDFEGDLYGTVIELELVAYLRQEIKFNTVEVLKEQINIDISMAKNILDKK